MSMNHYYNKLRNFQNAYIIIDILAGKIIIDINMTYERRILQPF